MQGRYFDGRTARPQTVEVWIDGGRLVLSGDGEPLSWLISAIRFIEETAGEVRLGEPFGGDGRLILRTEDWRTITAEERQAPGRRPSSRRLILTLMAAGVSVAALVFFGVPLAADPLARATPPNLEWRLGESLASQVYLAMPPCDDRPAAAAKLEKLGSRISEPADTPFLIQVQAVRAPVANAFALPGGRILVTDKLIAMVSGPDELAAVVAHEVAHVERRHVMQSVWRSMAVGLLLDATLGGGSGAGQQAVLLTSQLQKQKFSRTLEAEADARGRELLQGQGYSSLGMATFFDRIHGEPGDPDLEWLSSHPDTEKRAALARAQGRPGRSIMSSQEWMLLRSVCDANPQAARR